MSKAEAVRSLRELHRAVTAENRRHILVECERGRIILDAWDGVANSYGDVMDARRAEAPMSFALIEAVLGAERVLTQEEERK